LPLYYILKLLISARLKIHTILIITVSRLKIEIVKSILNRQLRELESKILDEIWSSKGDILEDEMAVQAVCLAKTLTNEVLEKKSNNEQTEVSIDKSRLSYQPVAEHASNLYFALVQLAALEPVYKFSLAWYTDLFTSVIDTTERVEDLQRRMLDLCTQLSLALYKSVVPCVFEKVRIR